MSWASGSDFIAFILAINVIMLVKSWAISWGNWLTEKMWSAWLYEDLKEVLIASVAS